MQKQIILTFASLFILAAYCQVLYDITNKTSGIPVHDKSEVLSRRKRFIVFPEGSSVQLGKVLNNKDLLLFNLTLV